MPVIHKILFITLSNFGDVVLTLPALDCLRQNFPGAEITVMVGPRPKEIFEGSPFINRLIIYDKYSRLREKIKLFNALKREKFDMVIDFRNSLFGALLPARYRTSPFLRIPKNIRHMKDRNLYRLQAALRSREPLPAARQRSFCPSQQDRDYVGSLLKEKGVPVSERMIAVSFGAGGDTRRWEVKNFAQLCSGLSSDYKVVLVGTKAHQQAAQEILRSCSNEIFDFTGLTSLKQLTCLLERSALVITCDTGTLQLASYLNKPIVVLFGPSDERRYGPWSGLYRVVKKEISCRPCVKAHCRLSTIECMRLIRVEDVLRQVKDIFTGARNTESRILNPEFKRILIVRTDRIGDVVLSTPVIKATRKSYPNAYIAMMVGPHAKDIIEGNPYLDEAIIYDKQDKHKGICRFFRFARNLKSKKFDLAIILHPANRVHLLAFLAGIPRRVGYDRKLGFLLTDRIRHTKQYAEKHEADYNLDLVRYLGIGPQDKELFMPLQAEAERWVEGLFRQEGITAQDKLLAIHPGASCVSKVWPAERFAEAAEKLARKYGFKILLIAGPKDITAADKTAKGIRRHLINLAGRTSVAQLASLLKRCHLFISNDSGPVHIASALGTPVISIFGRAQKGLSPRRWGPLGAGGRFLHKDAGCIQCLAHNCTKEFACLKAITVDDVLSAVDSMGLF